MLGNVTHNDDSIVVEDALDIVQTLQGKSRLIVLEEGRNLHTNVLAPRRFALEDIVAGRLVETESHRLNLLVVIEREGDILDKGTFVVLERKLHGYRAADSAVAQLVELQIGIADERGVTVMHQFVKHLVAVIGKQILHRLVVLLFDGINHLFDGLQERFGLSDLHGMRSNSHFRDSSLQDSLCLLLLRLVA